MSKITVDEAVTALQALTRPDGIGGYANFIVQMMIVCDASEHTLRRAYERVMRTADELAARKMDEIVVRRGEFRLAFLGQLPPEALHRP